ncbi:hemolysin family protein [Actinomadura napierensis]|uniref:Hemolysin family protein n=1 Tax=Actinomadura napierensis TaxID=267854 RepID=A0ABP5K2P3_9ACTN
MNIALGLAAVVVLTVATGYFVAQEFAFVTADRLALQQQAERGDKRAARALRVLERLSFTLSGAQLGITVTALVVGFIAKPALAALFAPALSAAGIPGGMGDAIALIAGLVVATVMQMVLGELLPKNLALAKPEPLARALASSTLAYLMAAGPLIKLFDAAANRVLRMVGIEPVEELHHGATLEELGHIIGESQAHLDDEHVDLLERALHFSDRTADEVMIPRVDAVTVPATAKAADLAETIAATGFTRYPVTGDSVDDLVGVVSLRDLLRRRGDDTTAITVAQLARPMPMIPGSLPLPDVVAQLRASRDRFACVVDEYGGFAGMLTIEDVAEEVVGDIADENDRTRSIAQRSDDGWWVTDAALRIDEIEDLTGISLPEGDYDTAAGLLLERLARLPVPGDALVIEADRQGGGGGRIEVEVLTIGHHVPEQIRLRSLLGPATTAAPAEEDTQ